MMSRRLAIFLIGIALVVGGVAGGLIGVFLYIDIAGGSGEPSVTISAPTLSLNMLQTPLAQSDAGGTSLARLNASVDALGTQVGVLSTAVAATESGAVSTEIAALREDIAELDRQSRPTRTSVLSSRPTTTRVPFSSYTPSLTITQSVTPTPSATPRPSQTLYRIVPEESEVRFTVLEDFGPDPGRLTIVGRTSQIAGDIIVDFENPSNSRLGTVRVNMRTLRTQYDIQTEALRGEVLGTARDEYEFSDFVPVELRGLPDHAAVGDTVEFQIVGDFPVRGVTRQLTWDATITFVSATELRGYAVTQTTREEYGLMAQSLAEHLVASEVMLEIEFVARAVTE